MPITEALLNYFIPTKPANIKRLVWASVDGEVGRQGTLPTTSGKANACRDDRCSLFPTQQKRLCPSRMTRKGNKENLAQLVHIRLQTLRIRSSPCFFKPTGESHQPQNAVDSRKENLNAAQVEQSADHYQFPRQKKHWIFTVSLHTD